MPTKSPTKKKKSTTSKKRKVARSAKSGKFVKKKFAAKHPNTTVTETIERPEKPLPIPRNPPKVKNADGTDHVQWG